MSDSASLSSAINLEESTMVEIICETDPNELIDKIGDRKFCICDEDFDENFVHKDHPKIVTIIDCEMETEIDISSGMHENALEMANALVKLLNQHYTPSLKTQLADEFIEQWKNNECFNDFDEAYIKGAYDFSDWLKNKEFKNG